MFKISKLSNIAFVLYLCTLMLAKERTWAKSQDYRQQLFTAKISISLKDGSAAQALVALSQKSGRAIGYDKNQLDLEAIRIKARNFQQASFEEVLRYILQHTGIQYTAVGDAVVLVKGSAANSYTLRLRITDSEQQPIGRASVKIGPIERSISSNAEGIAETKLPAGEYRVRVDHISYRSQELQHLVVGPKHTATYTLVLEQQNDALDEVVVTALGIKRQDKSLGFAVAMVKGESISQMNNDNFLTGMAGRVPGVSISSTGPTGASVSMLIRGAAALGYGRKYGLP